MRVWIVIGMKATLILLMMLLLLRVEMVSILVLLQVWLLH